MIRILLKSIYVLSIYFQLVTVSSSINFAFLSVYKFMPIIVLLVWSNFGCIMKLIYSSSNG
jgi:hypothetical protein